MSAFGGKADIALGADQTLQNHRVKLPLARSAQLHDTTDFLPRRIARELRRRLSSAEIGNRLGD